MQEVTGFVSVLHDLQTKPPLYYDTGFCPDLVKMNVKPVPQCIHLIFADNIHILYIELDV